MKNFIKSTVLAGLCFSLSMNLEAKVELPSLFSDNMVIQQKAEAAVWGKAKAGAKVTVRGSWDGKEYTSKADKNGKWELRVSTPAAGGPYELTVSDGEPVTLNNVLVGEVWFCSGQSNMNMTVAGSTSQPVNGGIDAIAKAKPSRPIRIFKVPSVSKSTPQENCGGSWRLNEPAVVAKASAVAYFFADYIQDVLDVPVGIVQAAWGGSTIRTWMPRELIESIYPGEYQKEFESIDSGKELPKQADHKYCSLLYNAMVNPLVPFTFKGILWYQGCSDREKTAEYALSQTAFAQMLRERFRIPEAPFYFVEIAPYKYNGADKFLSGYFREAQSKTLDMIPNSGMVSTTDIGSFVTIHPPFKREIGTRLAYLALQNQYGIKGFNAVVPRYESMNVWKGKIYVKFKLTGKDSLSPKGEIGGFEIAGADRVFKPAKASVTGADKIQVWSDEVKEPVAVRYCFRNWGVGTLFNSFNLPVSPFRTDNWDDLEK